MTVTPKHTPKEDSPFAFSFQKHPLKIDGNAGNLKIPLANGNVMNIPLSAINISEEVNRTGIWKHVNDSQEGKEKRKSPKAKSRFKKKKQSKKDDKREEKLEKRLSVCREEDEAITIKQPQKAREEHVDETRI